jgi:hypothetical protein
MRYLKHDEPEKLGGKSFTAFPYAVYGGKVYSVRVRITGGDPAAIGELKTGIVVHGSNAYAQLVQEADHLAKRTTA